MMKSDSKIIKNLFVVILGGKAGVSEIPWNPRPILKTPVIEHLEVICYDERHNAI